MPMSMRTTVLAGALAVLVPKAPLYAQESATPPVPLELPAMNSPTDALNMPTEGWIKFRYTVRADGTLADIRALDAMPPQLPTQPVLEAAKQWKFKPAQNGGKPIDWYNNESIIAFDNESVPLEASPTFSAAYVAVDELLRAQKYTEAQTASERLLGTASRLYEIGLAQAQSAFVRVRLSDLHGAYEAIQRATDPRIVTMQDSQLAEALRIRFGIEVQLGRVTEALETFARREALGAPADENLSARAATIEEALKTDAAIAVKGRVGQAAWAHIPTRRTFTIADVEGEINEIQAECDRRKQVIPFQADVDWTLPPGWGSCTLFVAARNNTTFSLYEFK
jgi:hypothetical protein